MADVGFGTVRGRYLSADADSSDPEAAPDLVPLEGSVSFTATASVIRVVGADPDPATILPRSVRVALDAEGYLAVDGSRDVTLLATDSAAGNPVDWQWHVDFALTRDGAPVYHVPFNFELPEGEIVDLTVVAPLVEPSPGTIIIQGPAGEGGSGSVPDATTLVKGIVRLAGDLAGTALNPTVPALADKAALTDPRFTDARTPLGHTHLIADLPVATSGESNPAELVRSDDARLSDARTPLSHSHVQSDVTNLVTDLAAKAPLASPTFTGTPAAPTPSVADNTTKLATTAFVKAAIDALIAAAPGTLDTLDELAAALGDDPNFAATLTAALAAKAPLASPALTGSPTAPTPTAGDNDTSIATTAFVTTAVAVQRGLYVGINAQTGTTYAPVLADQGKLVTLSNAGAITVTLPSNATTAFPIGASIDFAVIGAGMATFVAGSGATANGTPSLVSRAQWSTLTAIKINTNGWLIVGDLA
jgi:hypothetical protein